MLLAILDNLVQSVFVHKVGVDHFDDITDFHLCTSASRISADRFHVGRGLDSEDAKKKLLG